MEQTIKISGTMELIKSSWLIYRGRFTSFVGLQLITILAVAPMVIVLIIFAMLNIFMKNQNMSVVNIILGALGLISLIFLVYIAIAAQAGFIYMLKTGESIIANAFKAGRSYVRPILAVGFLTFILVLLGLILFIIPGIIFAVYYSLGSFVVVTEEKRNMAALNRSKELVKGYWWPVIGRGLLLGLISYVVFYILRLPNYIMTQGSIAFMLWNFTVSVISFFYGQFSMIFSYSIYKDLVKIKSGVPEPAIRQA